MPTRSRASRLALRRFGAPRMAVPMVSVHVSGSSHGGTHSSCLASQCSILLVAAAQLWFSSWVFVKYTKVQALATGASTWY